jgi:hypothetical protein
MILSYKLFESKYETEEITGQQYRDQTEKRIVFTKKEKSELAKYFAQYKAKIHISQYSPSHRSVSDDELDTLDDVKSYINVTVNRRDFAIVKEEDEWFYLRVRIYEKFVAISADVYNRIKSDPDIDSFQNNGKYYKKVETEEFYYKCDQMGGLIEKLNELFARSKKGSPDEFFNKEKVKEDFRNLKNDMIARVRKMSHEELLRFKDFK